MKLYGCPMTCSRAPQIMLEELERPYEFVYVKLMQGEGMRAEYLAINPIGAVPVLELDDGRRLREVQVILQYLCPANGNFELLQWLSFISTELHKSFYSIFFAERIHPDPDVQKQIKQHWQQRLEIRWAAVSAQLGQQDYLLGDFDCVDSYLFTVLTWAKMTRLDLSQWPNLTAYRERVQQRPAVVRVLEKEKALSAAG